MDAVFADGVKKDWPEEALRKEYFSASEAPDTVNEPFVLKLAKSGRTFAVPPDQRATDALLDVGITIDMKCSDGIGGVCAVPVIQGEIEHRDHVLSGKERQRMIILCCSRAGTAGGEVVVDL